MTKKRFRMETIDDMMLPFIVDNTTANRSGKITSYHTYETHRKDKCLELVDLLNELSDENEQLKQQLNRLYNYFEDWYSDMTSANDFSEIWDNVKEDERWGDKGDVE